MKNNKQTMYAYFNEMWETQGLEAMEAAQAEVWEMYNNNEEAFEAFVEANNIELGETFKNWCWDMEG